MDRSLVGKVIGRQPPCLDGACSAAELAILKEGAPSVTAGHRKTISFADFKGCLRSVAGLRSLVGRRVVLYVYDQQLLRRPLAIHVLLWLLSLGRACIVDASGRREVPSLSSIAGLTRGAATQWLARGKVLAAVEGELRALEQARTAAGRPPALTGLCLYLRSDLTFGLQAGGAIGHTAGVVNAFGRRFGKLLYVGTSRIDGIDERIPAAVVEEASAYRNFPFLQELHFSGVFSRLVLERLDGAVPALVYQRYSRNNCSGVRIARQLSCPLVIEYNSAAQWSAGRLRWSPASARLTERIELLNLRAADLIVVVSDALKSELTARGIAPEKILVNPNGVDAEKYRPDIKGGPARRELGCGSRLVIGFIGTFEPWHGVEILIEAFGRLLHGHEPYRDRLCLALMGNGPAMAECRRLIDRWQLGNSCILTGVVPQRLGPRYLAACDILACPNVAKTGGARFIGSPTKLFEYMAMGRAIIASDLDQLGEVLVDDETALLVEPASAQALMTAMKRLVDEPDTRARLGMAARAAALASHTWSQHSERIIERVCEV